MSLTQRDSQMIWHPFTQEKTADLPIVIKEGKGSYLFDDKGKKYVDLISSWWVNLHGHGHPVICDAIYSQAKKLEHVIFAGFTHEPAVLLCEKLRTSVPSSLTKFFFSDNGSTAVEVALKMAHQYWRHKGEAQRTVYLGFDGGYHGDTFGAMAVGKKSHFHDPFHKLLCDSIFLPFPSTWKNDEHIVQKEERALDALAHILQEKGNMLSAFICEPLVQGAGGMRMCRPEFLARVVRMIKDHGILVIYDEVMTGFGRLGTYFATEQVGVAPDFLCIAKGLTGGFLPLALTVTTQDIYDAFLDDAWEKAFAHGHSYTANPIACSAALASYELLQRQETHTAIHNIHVSHERGLRMLHEECGHMVRGLRCTGTIAAWEVNAEHTPPAYFKKEFLRRGLLLRPLGNTIYILPPYAVTTEDLDDAYSIIADVMKGAR